jgi:hypothetical protein
MRKGWASCTTFPLSGVTASSRILVVLFPCLFGVENGLVHSLIVATLAATLGLMLVLAYELNHPFRGDVRVQPDAFEQVRDQFMGDAPEAGRVGLFTLAA